jgi:hypothetical protein
MHQPQALGILAVPLIPLAGRKRPPTSLAKAIPPAQPPASGGHAFFAAMLQLSHGRLRLPWGRPGRSFVILLGHSPMDTSPLLRSSLRTSPSSHSSRPNSLQTPRKAKPMLAAKKSHVKQHEEHREGNVPEMLWPKKDTKEKTILAKKEHEEDGPRTLKAGLCPKDTRRRRHSPARCRRRYQARVQRDRITIRSPIDFGFHGDPPQQGKPEWPNHDRLSTFSLCSRFRLLSIVHQNFDLLHANGTVNVGIAFRQPDTDQVGFHGKMSRL